MKFFGFSFVHDRVQERNKKAFHELCIHGIIMICGIDIGAS